MNRNYNRSILNQKGMSLIEVLIALFVLALVLYPTYEFLRLGAQAWKTGENKTEVVQNARIGLDKMCAEMKHAREFYSLGRSSVRFWWRDADSDETADSNEILTFSWAGVSGGDLTRKFDSEAASSPISNYVDDFELRYYNALGGETTVLADVNFITATLKIKKTNTDSSALTIMRKSVYPRNLN